MEKDRALARFQAGLWVCWFSLLILPLGVFLGAVGMCAGPRSKDGAAALLSLGFCGIVAALYGGFTVLRGIRLGTWPVRIFDALSLCSAVLVGFAGWLYSLEARDYLYYVLGRGH